MNALQWIRGVAMAMLLLPVTLDGQRIDPDRIIDLHVNAEAQNQAFDGSVVEGGRFRLTFTGTGTFELSPVVADAEGRTFRITVYAGAEDAESGSLRAAETVVARLGVPVPLRSMPSVSVVVDGTRRRGGAAAWAESSYHFAIQSIAAPSFGECCVTCGLIRACGCAVTMGCGSCCADGCCPKPPIEVETMHRYVPQSRDFLRSASGCGRPVEDEERILTPLSARTSLARS
jgi:hypothetical protein